MIADEEHISASSTPIPNSIEQGTTLSKIVYTIEDVHETFIEHIADLKKDAKELNEEKLTQEFTIILNRRLIALRLPFLSQPEYRDIHNGSPGRSDLFFYASEEGESTASIFSVEAKRLTSLLPVAREREYVIGSDNNGGIERYKYGNHGRNLPGCGMLGYVEDSDFDHWHSNINEWIDDLAKTGSDWKKEEKLDFVADKTKSHFAYLKSIIIRKHEGTTLELHHFWIKIRPET